MSEPPPDGPGEERRHLPDRREGPPERRATFRGGRRATDFLLAGALAGAMSLAAASAGAAPGPRQSVPVRIGRRASDAVRVPAAALSRPMPFGMDMGSVARARSMGLPLSYGVFWVGAWNQQRGLDGPERELRAARKAGVTPVVHWWYWGDDISPRFVEEGGRDRRQGVHKDKATWNRMGRQLADLIDRTMDGREAVVVLETEFNKHGIETYAPFDGYLVEQIRMFHAKRNIKVVLGFGNWGKQHWGNFRRAVAEADLLGVQLLRSSVRDASSYLHAVDTLVAAARELRARFGKPSLVMDLALSSYPSQRYEAHQAAVVRELFARLGELKSAGVQGVLWRAMADDPAFDTSNYHGQAERHWGLLRADGTAKPAFAALLGGIRAEASPRVASAQAAGTTASRSAE